MKSKRKRLGQHFLRDSNVIRKIIQIVEPSKDETIVEIGAGRGALTIPLSQDCKKLIAVEKDRELVNFLKNLNLENVFLIERDILSLNLKEIVEDEVKVVGNLPYSISSRIIGWFIEQKEVVKEGIFMLQKEVAERTTANPGNKSYSSLSIHTQTFFETKIFFNVSPNSFSPPPEVVSSLIKLKKRKKPLIKIENDFEFFEFVKNCFMKRRKTLLNNLVYMGLKREDIEEAFSAVLIDPKKRPEEIEIEKFFNLWKALKRSYS